MTGNDWSAEFGPDDQPPPVPIKAPLTYLGVGATPFQAGLGYARRFPLDALPEPMAEYVRDLAVRKQVPVDLPVLTMLGILGSVAGPRITICRDTDWRQPLNLYTLCGLPSGAGKSPTIEELRRGLRRAAKALAVRHQEKVAQRVFDLRAEVEGLRVEANVISTPIPQRDALRNEAKRKEELAEELAATPPPPPILVFDGDTTPEALAQSMAHNEGAAGVIDDEGTFIRNLGGQYGGKTGNLGLVLVGYDCRYYRPQRANRQADPIERAALSLVLAPQPTIVADMMRNHMMDETGFVNRFLVCVPGELTGQRADRPSTYHADAPAERPDRTGRDWWAGLLESVVAYDIIGDTDPEDAATIQLTRGAWKRHVEYERTFERRMNKATGDLRNVAAWATKHCARVLRVAGLLHLAHGLCPDDELTEVVMESAITVGEWAIEHFLNAGNVVGLSEEAGRIKEYVDGTPSGVTSRSIIAREVFKGHAPAKLITGWLEELVGTGEYEIFMEPTAGRAKEMLRRRSRRA